MLPDPSQLVSFDRQEFATAFTWAMNAVSGAAHIADPTSVGFEVEEEDGTPMQVRFNDMPLTRVGIAMRERYGATDSDRSMSAMFRTWALMDLIRSGRLDEWVRLAQDGSGEREVAVRAIYAAAVVPLSKEYQFPWYAFLREVRRLEGGGN